MVSLTRKLIGPVLYSVRKKWVIRTEEEDEPTRGVAAIPFYHTVTNRLARLLHRRQFRTVTYPYKKWRQYLQAVKDPLGLNVPAVYEVPCECGTKYIAQTGRLVSVRIKEHSSNVRLAQLDVGNCTPLLVNGTSN